MNCIVVDDEPLAREGVVALIEKHANLNCLAVFNNAIKAEQFLHNNEVDLVFLDIEMPGVNGLDFARNIDNSNTLIIFTSAYKEYAIESYAIDAIDYLLKPILISRFDRAVKKAFAFHKLMKDEASEVSDITGEYLFIKSDRKYFKLLYNNILFIEGLKDYVIIHLNDDKVITAMNLKTIHSRLPHDQFLRVSKSYIVNESSIDSFDNNTIYIREHELPIGKVYHDDFFEKFLGKDWQNHNR